jgi:hypothetical protein
MKTKTDGRGKAATGSDGKSDYLEVRLGTAEKQAFKDAAELAGIALSAWVRERLRQSARKELDAAGQPVPFLPNKSREAS